MIDWPSDHSWFFAKLNITQFFKGKLKEESLYSDLKDSERGRGRSTGEELYTGLTRPTDGEYKELPLKGLSSGSRDTYDSLQMQPLTR
ncbi:Protein CREG1 [Dissostichus eleginoides]|uniref:Protein CREG1 n=1 Tax=Dissostichus eleginoides TaxID=100907 RepID=A0AAD9B2Z8_DISEL|nr:Protein CREG1 [Dissostichus eleginoides]